MGLRPTNDYETMWDRRCRLSIGTKGGNVLLGLDLRSLRLGPAATFFEGVIHRNLRPFFSIAFNHMPISALLTSRAPHVTSEAEENHNAVQQRTQRSTQVRERQEKSGQGASARLRPPTTRQTRKSTPSNPPVPAPKKVKLVSVSTVSVTACLPAKSPSMTTTTAANTTISATQSSPA